MDKRHDCVYDPDNVCMFMVRCGKRRGRWNGPRDWTAATLVAASTIVSVVLAGLLGELRSWDDCRVHVCRDEDREQVMKPTDVEWDKVTMPCLKCGRVMRARQNKENGSRFMGCTGWPNDCQATAPIPAYVILKAQGAESLPGFD